MSDFFRSGIRRWITRGATAGFTAALVAILGGCGLDGAPTVNTTSTTNSGTETAAIEINPDIGANTRQLLQSFHVSTLRVFVNQPGFGGGRMVLVPLVESDVYNPGSASAGAIGPRTGNPASEGFAPSIKPEAKSEHSSVHHAMPTIPELRSLSQDLQNPWHYEQVQLVGLVKNPTPVTYLTDRNTVISPDGEIPRRPLDGFESRGIAKLRQGETLYIEKLNGVQARVLGPIYAGAACMKCHERKGELLGAFAYKFTVGGPVPAPHPTLEAIPSP